MMPMLLLGVALSLLIGVSLGLLGGGGSILTVPILIYALGVEEKSAIASSLLIVGVTSLVASVQHARAGNVVWRVAMIFASSAMAGAFVGGRLAEHIPASVLLVLFAVTMFGTAFAMWRGRKPALSIGPDKPLPIMLILIEGLVVGGVTGLVGAGGGFLVVPALALLGGLSMPKAVGTSLIVIALKSFAGFAGYVTHAHIDWKLTIIVMVAAVAGSFGGAALSKKVAPEMLRKGFAVFVLVMALFLLFKQAQGFFDAPASTPRAAAPVASASEDRAPVVIDVRSHAEYVRGHAEGTTLIPIDEVAARLAEVDALTNGDKARAIVVVCQSGRRAGRAKQLLESAGYTNVENGGSWQSLAP